MPVVCELNKNFETEILDNVLTAVNTITLSNIKVLKNGKTVLVEFVASWSNATTDVDLAFIDNSIIPVSHIFGICYVKESSSYYVGIVERKVANVISVKLTKATTAVTVRAQWYVA